MIWSLNKGNSSMLTCQHRKQILKLAASSPSHPERCKGFNEVGPVQSARFQPLNSAFRMSYCDGTCVHECRAWGAEPGLFTQVNRSRCTERASTSTIRPSEMENPETPDSDSKAGWEPLPR